MSSLEKWLLDLPILGLYFFFFFILSCMNALCILDVNPLLIVSFANIFSHSAGCIFIFFMVSFAAEKLLSLIKSC